MNSVTIENIDLPLLKRQKRLLLKAQTSMLVNREVFDGIEGVLNLLDVITDKLEEDEQ